MFKRFGWLFLILLCGCSQDYGVIKLQPDCPETFDVTYKARVTDSDIPEDVGENEVVDCYWEVEFMNLTEESNIHPCLGIDVADVESGEGLEEGAWVKPSDFYPTIAFAGGKGSQQTAYLDFQFRGAESGTTGLILYADNVELDRQKIDVE